MAEEASQDDLTGFQIRIALGATLGVVAVCLVPATGGWSLLVFGPLGSVGAVGGTLGALLGSMVGGTLGRKRRIHEGALHDQVARLDWEASEHLHEQIAVIFSFVARHCTASEYDISDHVLPRAFGAVRGVLSLNLRRKIEPLLWSKASDEQLTSALRLIRPFQVTCEDVFFELVTLLTDGARPVPPEGLEVLARLDAQGRRSGRQALLVTGPDGKVDWAAMRQAAAQRKGRDSFHADRHVIEPFGDQQGDTAAARIMSYLRSRHETAEHDTWIHMFEELFLHAVHHKLGDNTPPGGRIFVNEYGRTRASYAGAGTDVARAALLNAGTKYLTAQLKAARSTYCKRKTHKLSGDECMKLFFEERAKGNGSLKKLLLNAELGIGSTTAVTILETYGEFTDRTWLDMCVALRTATHYIEDAAVGIASSSKPMNERAALFLKGVIGAAIVVTGGLYEHQLAGKLKLLLPAPPSPWVDDVVALVIAIGCVAAMQMASFIVDCALGTGWAGEEAQLYRSLRSLDGKMVNEHRARLWEVMWDPQPTIG